MAFLSDSADASAKSLATFRTVIDLPAARRPMLINTGGPARFTCVVFDPQFHGWQLRWQFLKNRAGPQRRLQSCPMEVDRGRYYIVWRKSGADTLHGIATSDNALYWTASPTKS